MLCPDLQNYILADHTRWEMRWRSITEAHGATVLTAPEQEQCEEIRPGRCVYQSRLTFGELPKVYLLRVFVDIDRDPPEVVTVYRTSKVQKYWR